MATGKVATDAAREVNDPEEGLDVSITPLTANRHSHAAATENVSSLADGKQFWLSRVVRESQMTSDLRLLSHCRLALTLTEYLSGQNKEHATTRDQSTALRLLDSTFEKQGSGRFP